MKTSYAVYKVASVIYGVAETVRVWLIQKPGAALLKAAYGDINKAPKRAVAAVFGLSSRATKQLAKGIRTAVVCESLKKDLGLHKLSNKYALLVVGRIESPEDLDLCNEVFKCDSEKDLLELMVRKGHLNPDPIVERFGSLEDYAKFIRGEQPFN